VRVQIIQHDRDPFRCGIVLVGKLPPGDGPLRASAALADLDLTPTREWLTEQKLSWLRHAARTRPPHAGLGRVRQAGEFAFHPALVGWSHPCRSSDGRGPADADRQGARLPERPPMWRSGRAEWPSILSKAAVVGFFQWAADGLVANRAHVFQPDQPVGQQRQAPARLAGWRRTAR
jgi:hypothetical protein